MGWFRRQNDSGDDRAAENGVASDLADFLLHATEGRALRQAIDARMLALEEADADTEGQRGTDRHRGRTTEPGSSYVCRRRACVIRSAPRALRCADRPLRSAGDE
jgi:hypothetical protein